MARRAKLENSDIGFVERGQPVRIKLAAYPFTKYGMLEGRVRTISADAARRDDAERGGETSGEAPSFKAVIELAGQRLASNGLDLPIGAGMQVSAEIRQG